MAENRDVFFKLDNSIQSEVKIGDDIRLPKKGRGNVLSAQRMENKGEFLMCYMF